MKRLCLSLLIVTPLLAAARPGLGACPAGKVVDDAGHPVLKAEIYLNGLRAGESGPDGNFKLKCDNRAAPFLVQAEADDYVPAEQNWKKDDSRITLVPDTALRGRLAGEKGPLAAVSLSLIDSDLLAIRPFDEGNFPPRKLAQAITSPGGRFRFPGIRGGIYRLILAAAGQAGILSETLKFLPAKWQSREFKLGGGANLTGRVLAGGKPVAGAEVRPAFHRKQLHQMFDHMDSALPLQYLQPVTARTGADGGFTFDGLQADVEVGLFVAHPGHAYLFKAPLKPGEQVELHLTAGGTVTGHVHAKKGVLPSGLTVKVYPEYDSERWFLPGTEPASKSATLLKADADGIPYHVDEVMVGTSGLAADAPGFTPAGDYIKGLEAGGTAQLDFTLERGWRLTGEVVNEKGQPLNGVIIRPQVVGGDSWEEAGERARTHNGRFDLYTLKFRIIDLSINAPGYAQQLLKAVDAEAGRPLKIIMHPCAVVSGQVVDENNRPVTEFAVGADGEGYMQDHPVVNEEGRFSVRLSLAETRTVSFTTPGREPLKVSNLSLKAGDKSDLGILTFPAGLKLAGRVLDERDQPVERARITAYRREDDKSSTSTTNRRGEFELIVGKHGIYQMRASHSLYIDSELETDIHMNQAPTPIIMRLKKGLRLVVELQNEAGLPSAGEEVMASGVQGMMREEAPGRYVAEGIVAGKTLLYFLTSPSFTRVVELAPDYSAPLRIRRGRTRLEGIVRRGGQPAAGEIVKLSKVNQMSLDGFNDNWMSSAHGSNGIETDATGRFRWNEVPNGDYWLHSANVSKRLTLDGVPHLNVDLDLAGGGLRGCVVDASNSKPLSGVKVRVFPNPGVEIPKTDETGCYRVDSLPPETYTIVLSFGNVRLETKPVEVKAVHVEVPTLAMVIGSGTIEIQIAHRNGGTIPSYCDVKYSYDNGKSEYSADLEGPEGVLKALPPGDYQIYVTCPGRATARSSVLLQEPDGMSAALKFVTVTESVLTIRLNDATGKPVDQFYTWAGPTDENCPTNRETEYGHHGNTSTIKNLPACNYRVVALTPDDKTASTTLLVDAGVTLAVLLTLE